MGRDSRSAGHSKSTVRAHQVSPPAPPRPRDATRADGSTRASRAARAGSGAGKAYSDVPMDLPMDLLSIAGQSWSSHHRVDDVTDVDFEMDEDGVGSGGGGGGVGFESGLEGVLRGMEADMGATNDDGGMSNAGRTAHGGDGGTDYYCDGGDSEGFGGDIDPSALEAEMQMEEGSLLVSMISQALGGQPA